MTSLVQRGFDVATARAWEGLFTLGGPGLHVRGSLEEHLSGAPQDRDPLRRPANVTAETFPDRPARWGTYVPGVYGPHPLLGNELINLPWCLGLAPIVDGARLDLAHAAPLAFARRLDLETAVLSRETTWRAPGGATVTATFERFVSAERRGLCAQRCTIVADRPASLQIVAGIDAGVRTNGHDHLRRVRLERTGPRELCCALTTDGGDDVAIASALRGPLAWTPRRGPRRLDLVGRATLAPGRPIVIDKRSAVARGAGARSAAAAALAAAADRSFDDLRDEHAAVWRRRWDDAAVRIDGDSASDLALQVAVHHLLRAHPHGSSVAIDAKAYAGEAYFGRFFWDTELFVLPLFLYTDPRRAIELVRFRTGTLAGSRRNAARGGAPGARVAWEADPHGDEQCPGWLYADHELHVTAGVACALAHAAAATGAQGLLDGDGARLIVECARFWLSRIDATGGDDGRPRATLRAVMGPDEYTPLVDDNAYTNRMVSLALRLAADVGGAGGATAAERRAFAQVAAELPVLRHPADPSLVLQSAGFHRLADPAFDRSWPDRTRPFAAQVPQETLFRTRCLKQADVLMLMAVRPDDFTHAEVRRAWDEYVPLTTHDSSLSPGVHALVATRLGLDEEAWSLWQRAAAIDLDVRLGGAAEGIHAANAGLLWQVVLFGFAGMRDALRSPLLRLDPRLPPAWRGLDARITWRGVRLAIAVQRDRVTIRRRAPDPAAADLDAMVMGETRAIAANGRATVWRRR